MNFRIFIVKMPWSIARLDEIHTYCPNFLTNGQLKSKRKIIMENMYQQAIADAKALRASAMANAKAALQEAFEPKIEEMVRLKLTEELEEDENLEEFEMEGYGQDNMEEGDETYMEEGNLDLEESELEEILAELEEMSNEGYENPEALEEAEGEDDEEKTPEDEEAPAPEGDEAEVVDDEEGETTDIVIKMKDLKTFMNKLIQSAPELKDELGIEAHEEDDFSDEGGEGEFEDKEETVSLDEILSQLEEEEEEKLEEKKGGKFAGAYTKSVSVKHKALEEELEEAKDTIAKLQESFNEINLLNAKLLYMNKIFKAKSLNESEKIKVVKAFDRAASVKEVKNTFETLNESLSASKKTQLKESFGYASKPAGVSPKTNVIEADPFVSRWQKIAGL